MRTILIMHNNKIITGTGHVKFLVVHVNTVVHVNSLILLERLYR
jgi:hypothetical protein